MQTKIFLSLDPTDMRKGFDGLCGLVSNSLLLDPLSGTFFLFVNRRRDRMKVLYWDGDGLPSGIVVSNKGHFKSQVELTV